MTFGRDEYTDISCHWKKEEIFPFVIRSDETIFEYYNYTHHLNGQKRPM